MIVECPANARLQDVLLERGIHLLTACAGRGSCGKCRVRIVRGNAAINAMDRVWFTEAELSDGYRLGCQVFAKEPLAVEIGGPEHAR